MPQNFCVIDTGTNAVKCKMFTEDEYYTPFNKFLSNKGSDDLDADEVVKYISEFMTEAEAKKIDKKNIYIAATEGFRTSLNQEEIQQKVKEKTGRKIHLISPKKEAWLSTLGGLSSIHFKGTSPKQVIYIESGGGSTEVSLVNTSSKPISLIATTSLPLGSKRRLIDEDEKETQKVIDNHVAGLLARAQKKE